VPPANLERFLDPLDPWDRIDRREIALRILPTIDLMERLVKKYDIEGRQAAMRDRPASRKDQ
jgi:hypothetical protein